MFYWFLSKCPIIQHYLIYYWIFYWIMSKCSRQWTDVYSQDEVLTELNMKVYCRNSNKNIFTIDIKPDGTMKEVAGKIQDKLWLNACHVSVTMANNFCGCGKRIKHLLLESLDNPVDIEKESKLEIESSMENSFTYVNPL